MARLQLGGFVVVWSSPENNGDIRGQMFLDDGQRRGGEFTVNAAVAGRQTSPSVAGIEGGGFVVAWNSDGNVKSQAFLLTAQRSGAEFTVDLPDYPATPAAGQYLADASPEVADLPGDGYVLAWSFENRSVNTPFPGAPPAYNVNSSAVRAQLVTDAGNARGGVIAGSDFYPFAGAVDVAVLSNGNFVISNGRVLDGGAGHAITEVQIRDQQGNVVLSRRDALVGFTAGLAALPLGGFALTAETTRIRTVREPLRGASFDSAGANIGVRASATFGTFSSVSGSPRNFFLSAFQVDDGDRSGIGAQLFSPSAEPLGTAFRVNSVTAGEQVRPDVAFLLGSRAVIVWRDRGGGQIKAQFGDFSPSA